MNLGKFITIEGIDGAGKSSHLAAIADWLRARGLTVVETREPGGTALGEQLRGLILHQTMAPMTELLAVFTARAEHVAQVIAPALVRGDWVVCDRFTDSTRAYQGGGRGMDTALIEQLAALTHAQCNPDLTLVFDIDLAVAAARIHDRTSQGRATDAAPEDKFESAPQSFARSVQAAYHGIVAREPQRCLLINGGQTMAQVRADVLAALAARLARFL
jgi:dTMP kinase